MSRGLGVLQRQILESLEAAREAQPTYDRGRVLYRRIDLLLPEDIYDLRCVSNYLARQRRYPVQTRHQFWPMFSRAVKGLVARGLLQPLTFVPLARVRMLYGDVPDWFISYTGDEPVLHWPSKQIRFVKR